MDNALTWIAVISSAVALLGTVFGLYVSIRKHPFDVRKLGTDADKDQLDLARSYKEMAASQLKENQELRKQILDIREEQKDICDELERMQQSNQEKDQLIDEWRIGIERLIAQIISLDHTPVWRPKSVKTAEIK